MNSNGHFAEALTGKIHVDYDQFDLPFNQEIRDDREDLDVADQQHGLEAEAEEQKDTAPLQQQKRETFGRDENYKESQKALVHLFESFADPRIKAKNVPHRKGQRVVHHNVFTDEPESRRLRRARRR